MVRWSLIGIVDGLAAGHWGVSDGQSASVYCVYLFYAIKTIMMTDDCLQLFHRRSWSQWLADWRCTAQVSIVLQNASQLPFLLQTLLYCCHVVSHNFYKRLNLFLWTLMKVSDYTVLCTLWMNSSSLWPLLTVLFYHIKSISNGLLGIAALMLDYNNIEVMCLQLITLRIVWVDNTIALTK